jgi:hypothetical protein
LRRLNPPSNAASARFSVFISAPRQQSYLDKC